LTQITNRAVPFPKKQKQGRKEKGKKKSLRGVGEGRTPALHLHLHLLEDGGRMNQGAHLSPTHTISMDGSNKGNSFFLQPPIVSRLRR
jgi:hypothetical protein